VPRFSARFVRVPERGASLIEVLVTIVILAAGLVGLVGLQARLQVLEFESYQRSQALLLLQDMVSRIDLNRRAADAYEGQSVVAGSCPSVGSTVASQDLAQWCGALEGAGEQSSSGQSVGAMLGGRGCISQAGGAYLVTVAWQGVSPLSSPPSSVTCGQGLYQCAGSGSSDERCRRVVTAVVGIASLSP
jgi:type IV pilus assembly protein PilV